MTTTGVTGGSTGSTGVTGGSHGSSHTLTFSRLRANFTVDKELIGKQDPYVIFHSGHAKVQTKAIKGVGTGTAEWKESYTLEKFSPSSSSVVEVTVYNHNTLLPDSVIGSGTVDLSRQGESSLSGSGDPLTVNLVDKKGSNVGTLSFVTHGGGYTGSGARSGAGVGSGTGVGSGHTGTGHHHTGSGVASGVGAGAAGAGAGTVVGKGIGSDQHTAQKASDRAAAEGRQVTVEGKDGVGVGHPTHTGSGHHHTGSGHHHTGTGVGSGTGVTSDRGVTGAGVGTGHHHTGHHHTGTGVTGVEAGRGAYGEKDGEVIDRKYYTGTEARPQDQALVEQYREHNPYAKDYETTVQHTGRERLVGSQIEALGTRERVIGQSHNVEAHPHDHIARNLPTGALPDRPGGEGWVQTKPGPVCDTNTFSISGDRTVDKERVTDLREHREFEKEFEVKTRLVGERALNQGTDAEILNRERVLVDEKNKNACEGHPDAAVGSGVGSGTTGAYGSGTSGYGSSGTGTGVGTGHHHHTGTGVGGTGVGSGTGLGSGTGGSGYGSGTGTGQRSTVGEKAAGFIPGSEENRDKKQGYAPGQGPEQTTGNRGVGEKAASFIPGSEENREKKQGTAGTGAQRAI